jgi:hypothetical protein
MNTIGKAERERIFGVAVALVENTDFDAGSRFDRRRRADAFIEELMRKEAISRDRAQTAIATAYRRIRYKQAQETKVPDNGG